MATPKVKFSFTIKELTFNFEGDQVLGQQVQQGMQESLNGLADAQLRVLGIEDQSKVVDSTVVNPTPRKGRRRRAASSTPAAVNGDGASPAATNGKKSRSGPSLKSLLEGLIAEAYFAKERPVSEVLVALENKGHPEKSSAVSMALLNLTKAEKLTRRTNENGVFVYKATK